MKYECIESTIDFEVFGYKVRLWVDVSDIDNLPWLLEQKGQITSFIAVHEDPTIRKVCEFCANLLNVNAAQVKQTCDSGTELGLMLYTVPFDKAKRDE